MASQSSNDPSSRSDFYETMRDKLLNAPTVSESVCTNCDQEPPHGQSIAGVVQFGPVMTIGEINLAGKKGGPKKQYEDRLYNPTAKVVYDHMEIICKHYADEEKKKRERVESKKKKDNKSES